MKRLVASALLLVVAAVLGIAFVFPVTASAQNAQRSGPSVVVSKKEVSIGGITEVTVTGFRAKIVTVSICGNEGRRGSADCDLANSQTVEFPTDGSPGAVRLAVSAPPAPCPCIVLAASDHFDELATVSLAVIGHPSGPVSGSASTSTPLVVHLSVSRASSGVLGTVRSALGGPTDYDVEVTVRNISSTVASGVSIRAYAGRDAQDRLAEADMPVPGDLRAGETWTRTVRVRLGAPVYGTVRWQAVATTAGISISDTAATSNRPVALLVFLLALVMCVCALAVRLVVRLVRRRWKVNKQRVMGAVSTPFT